MSINDSERVETDGTACEDLTAWSQERTGGNTFYKWNLFIKGGILMFKKANWKMMVFAFMGVMMMVFLTACGRDFTGNPTIFP